MTEWVCPNKGEDDRLEHRFFSRRRVQIQEITILENGRQWAMDMPLVVEEYALTVPRCCNCGEFAVLAEKSVKPKNRVDKGKGGNRG